MSKETENILRFSGLIAVFLLIMAVALGRIRKLEKQIYELEHAPADTVTVAKHDTIKIDSPVPVYKYIKEKEYIAIHDTTLITETDTVTHIIQLPREYLVYKDSTYRAVVSGVQPRLDSMEVYQKIVTETITKTIAVPDKKRWGLGVNVGAGWNGQKVGPYVGVGVQYNIIRW